MFWSLASMIHRRSKELIDLRSARQEHRCVRAVELKTSHHTSTENVLDGELFEEQIVFYPSRIDSFVTLKLKVKSFNRPLLHNQSHPVIYKL